MRVLLLVAAVIALGALGSLAGSHPALERVADVFAFDGYDPQESFEVHPLDLEQSKADAQAVEDKARMSEHDRLMTKVREGVSLVETSATVEERASAMSGLEAHLQTLEKHHAERTKRLHSRMKAQRRAELAREHNAPAPEDDPEQTQGQAQDDAGEMRFRSQRFFGVVKGLINKGKKMLKGATGAVAPNLAQFYEDCAGCRMVWKQVEMDVSNARYVEDVQSSFEHNCMDAQKSQIFYKVCEDMYDDMYALTDDYMSGRYTVEEMCLRGKLCVSGTH